MLFPPKNDSEISNDFYLMDLHNVDLNDEVFLSVSEDEDMNSKISNRLSKKIGSVAVPSNYSEKCDYSIDDWLNLNSKNSCKFFDNFVIFSQWTTKSNAYQLVKNRPKNQRQKAKTLTKFE